MTIKRYAGDKLVGLSSDTKPTNIPDGATFYESDTLTSFLLEGGGWAAMSASYVSPLVQDVSISGNVGIGTTDFVNQHPDTKLFVLGGITFEETTAASENNLPAITQWSTDGTAQDLVIGTRSATGKVLFYTGNSGTGGDWASGTNDQRMVIDSSGNVGIGTTNPTALLHINETGTPKVRITREEASITNTETLGVIEFGGDTGSGHVTGAQIVALAENTWTGTSTGAYLSFWTTADTTTGHTEKVRIDHNGNVGIGETNPSFPLHVNGAIYSSDYMILGATSRTSNESLSMNSDGTNLLIRATGASTVGSYIDFRNSNSTHRALFGVDGSQFSGTAASGRFTIGTWTNGTDITFVTNDGGTLSQAMTLNSNRYLAIGHDATLTAIPTPDSMLHIKGTSTSDTNLFKIQDNSSNDIMFVSSSGKVGIGITDLGTPTFNMSGSAKFGHTSDSDLAGSQLGTVDIIGKDTTQCITLINNNDPFAAAFATYSGSLGTYGQPRFTFDVTGQMAWGDGNTYPGVYGPKISSYGDAGSAGTGRLYLDAAGVGTAGDLGVGMSPWSIAYDLDVNGDVRADTYYYDVTSTLQSSSDKRLKTNITSLSSHTEKLLQLNPVDFEWSEEKDNQPSRRERKKLQGVKDRGLIAQEVQEIYPELISEDADGYLTVSYTGLIIPMLKTIQEQQKQIDELKKLISGE